MFCTASQETNAMLVQLLLDEKEDTRVWLRAEMDRLVDSMFHRLTNKLMMMNSQLELYQSDVGSQLGNHDDQLCPPPNQLHQSSFVIAKPTSTSSHLMPQHQNVHYSYQQQPNDPIHSNGNSNQQSQLMISLIQPSTMSPNANFEVPIPNEPTTTDQVHSLPTSSQSAIANEQSNQNFDEDAGECYCDECLGAIKIDDEVEDDDDSDSVQCIEDEQEDGESSRHVKRPRMDSIQPNNATQPEVASQSPRQATDESQTNQLNKQIITVHLQCPLSECPDTFPEDQLNQHMFDVHSMGPFRCLVKDCGQCFDSIDILKKHRNQAHQHTTQWHCDKCIAHFPNYNTLSIHNNKLHQLGHFQCSFPACTFTGEYKRKMYDHYRQQHKLEFVCSQTGCNYRTWNVTILKEHECAHLGIKPYRCKWPDCDYFSSYNGAVLKHIRNLHLARLDKSSNLVDVAHSAHPKDYLEKAS